MPTLSKSKSSQLSPNNRKPSPFSTPRIKKVYRPRPAPPAPSTQKFLNLCEVVAEFDGSTWTWRHRALNGVVASTKLGGEKSKLLLARKDIEAFFERGYRPAICSS